MICPSLLVHSHHYPFKSCSPAQIRAAALGRVVFSVAKERTCEPRRTRRGTPKREKMRLGTPPRRQKRRPRREETSAFNEIGVVGCLGWGIRSFSVSSVVRTFWLRPSAARPRWVIRAIRCFSVPSLRGTYPTSVRNACQKDRMLRRRRAEDTLKPRLGVTPGTGNDLSAIVLDYPGDPPAMACSNNATDGEDGRAFFAAWIAARASSGRFIC